MNAEHIEKTIAAMEERAVQLETYAAKVRAVVVFLRAFRDGKPLPDVTRTVEEVTKVPTSDRQEKQPGSRDGFSQYTGVYNGGKDKQGRQRFLASTWVDGKNKGLGTFFIEEEAAAAVQNAKGNKAEASRLLQTAKQKAADLLEQADNNPDRQPRGRKHGKVSAGVDKDPDDPAGEGGETTNMWECTNCFHQHLQKEKPVKCEACGQWLHLGFTIFHTELRPLP